MFKNICKQSIIAMPMSVEDESPAAWSPIGDPTHMHLLVTNSRAFTGANPGAPCQFPRLHTQYIVVLEFYRQLKL